MNQVYSLDTKLVDLTITTAQVNVDTTTMNAAEALEYKSFSNECVGGTTELINLCSPYVQQHYPDYTLHWNTSSQFEKAFNIVQVLMEKKLIKEPKTIKDFIELVNIFVKEL